MFDLTNNQNIAISAEEENALIDSIFEEFGGKPKKQGNLAKIDQNSFFFFSLENGYVNLKKFFQQYNINPNDPKIRLKKSNR